MRSTSTAVFPEPAAAATSRLHPLDSRTAVCSSVHFMPHPAVCFFQPPSCIRLVHHGRAIPANSPDTGFKPAQPPIWSMVTGLLPGCTHGIYRYIAAHQPFTHDTEDLAKQGAQPFKTQQRKGFCPSGDTAGPIQGCPYNIGSAPIRESLVHGCQNGGIIKHITAQPHAAVSFHLRTG